MYGWRYLSWDGYDDAAYAAFYVLLDTSTFRQSFRARKRCRRIIYAPSGAAYWLMGRRRAQRVKLENGIWMEEI